MPMGLLAAVLTSLLIVSGCASSTVPEVTNGDAVLVEVLAQPGTGMNRVVVDSVTAGEIPSEDSQCGPTDDRVLSSDPRAARLLPIGCTGWIIDDCQSCFLTAGHCSGGSQIVEFNVPLSTSKTGSWAMPMYSFLVLWKSAPVSAPKGA